MAKTKLPIKLVKYLEKAGVNHKILEHKTVYTAYDAAATMRRKLGEIAKTLFIKADKDYYLVLLPADYNIDFKKLASCIGIQAKKEIHPVKSGKAGARSEQFNRVKVVKIPGEKIMTNVLKIKAGALSAFGALHKLPVIADKGLAKVKKAIFSAGSFNHSVEMAVKDFIKLEKAVLGSFGVKKKVKLQKVKKSIKKK